MLPQAAVQVSILTLYSLQYISPSGVVIQYGMVSFGAATGCGTGEHTDTVLYSLQCTSPSGVVIQYGIVSFGAATGCGTGEHTDTVQSPVHIS